jgi:hypothetical protein
VGDHALVQRLVDEYAPYWPVQRYFANSAEYAALSGNAPGEMIVAPVFRGDWAVDGEAQAGVAPLLHDERFVAAARQVFGAAVVRPHTVYVNLTWQLPFAQGVGHTDIPAFRGFDRRDWPVSVLSIMGLSGLFEDVRVKIATGVGWFHRRTDGGFEYWPEGPDAPSVVHEGAVDNTMIVADNDYMWHRVRPTGQVADGMATLSLDSELVRRGVDEWAIVDGDTELAVFGRDELRISLSWKADVFLTEDEARLHDDHSADIDLAGVLDRFATDLRARGVDVTIPDDDPVRDPGFIALLQQHYVRYPTTSSAA